MVEAVLCLLGFTSVELVPVRSIVGVLKPNEIFHKIHDLRYTLRVQKLCVHIAARGLSVSIA